MLAAYTTLTNSWSAFSFTLKTLWEVGIGNSLWAGEETELEGAKDLSVQGLAASRERAGLPQAWGSLTGGAASFSSSHCRSPGQPPSAEEASSYLRPTLPARCPEQVTGAPL